MEKQHSVSPKEATVGWRQQRKQAFPCEKNFSCLSCGGVALSICFTLLFFPCCICTDLNFQRMIRKCRDFFTTFGAAIQNRESHFLELWKYDLYNAWFVCLFVHLKRRMSILLVAFAQTWLVSFKRIIQKWYNFFTTSTLYFKQESHFLELWGYNIYDFVFEIIFDLYDDWLSNLKLSCERRFINMTYF